MSTLAELVRARTDSSDADVDWLHRLVGEWQLVADLSFADLVLRVRTRDGAWLAVAHMRPTTATTTSPEDLVGTELAPPAAALCDRARSTGRTVHAETPWSSRGVPSTTTVRQVRQEAVPVRHADRVVAVLVRLTDLAATRMPSPLELTYLTTAGELLQMISEGTFPFRGQRPERTLRVGDGLLRLDRTGHVVYASPNALSAYRRLGVGGDLLGAHLGQTIARLSAAPGVLDEPRGSAALAAVLRFHEPRESEVEARGSTMLLRALPLVPGGHPRGALVLLRDVTEVRSRERQILGKDATIREIHHRVKNNLQTVAALLRLQARRLDAPEARAALEESVRRVASIAMVHETLSQALDEAVDFDRVADRILAMCAEVAVAESAVRVERYGSFGELHAEVATPLAMALTELVQNAVEHAYPEPTPTAGCVQVEVARAPTQLRVVVADDGRGLPEGFALDRSARLGLQIVRTLVEGELRGTLVVERRAGTGTRAVLDLPLPAS